MISRRRSFLANIAACALLAIATAPATAEPGTPIGGVTHSDAVGIGVAIAAIGAGIGIAVFYAVHHSHSLDGCAVSGPSGLEIQNQGNQQAYALIGEIDGIKLGNQVRVSGKKEKKVAGATQQFLVEKLSKDFGSCKAQPATR